LYAFGDERVRENGIISRRKGLAIGLQKGKFSFFCAIGKGS
jgi:predicted ThiF/HesA family dinucleotide-utilizing enzyme